MKIAMNVKGHVHQNTQANDQHIEVHLIETNVSESFSDKRLPIGIFQWLFRAVCKVVFTVNFQELEAQLAFTQLTKKMIFYRFDISQCASCRLKSST